MGIYTDEELYAAVEKMKRIGTDLLQYELKRGRKGFPKTADTISAFSNGGGGSIIYGISESDFHPVQGLDVKSTQDKCAQAARELVMPPVNPDIRVLDFENEPVVVANISEAPLQEKPIYVKSEGRVNGSYIRTGDGDHKMTLYEIDRLMENQRQIALHDTAVVQEAVFEDLDPVMTADWLRQVRRHASYRVAAMSDEELLINRRVVARDGEGIIHPTLAGIMALGSYPQKYFPRLNVMFASYPTSQKGSADDPRRFLDSQTIEGPIPDMIVDTVNAVSRNIKHGGIVEGALRKDIPDYPLVAVREAVANALLHRDYSREGSLASVLVELFPDRLVISNPGGLFGPLSVEELLTASLSFPRNPNLARILGNVVYETGRGQGNVVENFGTGIPMIQNALAKALMPKVRIKSSLREFQIVFRHRSMTPEEGTGYSRENVAKAIRAYLEEHGGATAAEITAAAGLARSTVQKYLRAFIADGTVEAVGHPNSPNRFYRLVQD